VQSNLTYIANRCVSTKFVFITTCFGLCISHRQVVHFIIIVYCILYNLRFNKKVYNMMMADIEAETCSCYLINKPNNAHTKNSLH